MGLRLEIFHDLPTHEDFRQQWNLLVRGMAQPEVFYTWEWVCAVTQSFKSVKPLIFAVYREGTLAGVVALEDRDDITFLTAPTADYCDFISAPNDRGEFLDLVLRELGSLKVASMRLANLPAGSKTARLLQSLDKRSSYSQFSRPAYACAQIELSSPEQRTEALLVSRNSPKRSARLSRLGKVTVEHHSSWNGFAGEFANFVDAHIARFRSQGKSSSLEDPERRSFLAHLGTLLSEHGSLRCSLLRIGDRAVAWHFGMAYSGKWFWYQPAIDQSLDQVSPGTYLLREVIRDAASDPDFTRVDLGLGDESYKAKYSNSMQQTLHFTLESSKIRLAREMSRYYAAEAIKRSPRLERLARAGVATVSAFTHGAGRDRAVRP